MWNPTSRRQHSRAALRYGSDLTDAEWLLLSPLLPPPSGCGRHRKWEMREIVNAVFYVLRGGIAWNLLPRCFPPWPTVYRWFARFRHDGTWEAINHQLVVLDREREGREARDGPGSGSGLDPDLGAHQSTARGNRPRGRTSSTRRKARCPARTCHWPSTENTPGSLRREPRGSFNQGRRR